MQPQMQRHVGAVGEALVAMRTRIGPFAGVRALVLLQQHLTRERFATLLAHVGLYTW